MGSVRERLAAKSKRLPPRADQTIGCLVWTGHTDRKGYGRTSVDRVFWSTHRLAFFFATGETPPVVRHTCDNPPCFELSHLLGGTVADNSADMVARGRCRPPKGERHGLAKLTTEQARAIRCDERSLRTIGSEYGVDKSTVWAIKKGITWTDA